MKCIKLPSLHVCLLFIILTACTGKEEKRITILETTDLHGVVLPYDYIEKEPLDASLANTASYVRMLRDQGDPVFLLDNGDNLQGQPSVYYYNFIDTVSPHLLAEAMDWLGYDAASVGNHDIEAGHAVYDRLSDEYNFPLLAANAVDKKTGQPYFTPFVILEKDGIRIAVLGLITPAVPTWLPEGLYKGIEFRDMVKTAKIWMPEIRRQKPDLIVGLFHSGWDRDDTITGTDDPVRENGTSAVAFNVPGFDIIFCGHDHRPANEKFVNSEGDSILILNAGSRSANVAQAGVTISRNPVTGKKKKIITGAILNVRNYKPDDGFLTQFSRQDEIIRKYVDKVIGYSSATISSRDSYFGPSAFVGMIHDIQLEITGADISFAAPLSFDVKISRGHVTVGDIFKLYRFENMLYTMELSGSEIKKYLEYSYSGWINTMNGPADYLLKYRTGPDGKPALSEGRAWLLNQPYNFDSGAGLVYNVDASKPDGRKVNILSLSNGREMEDKATYRVAVNSYRGNGGGGHLVDGAGIKSNDLMSRVVSSTGRDLRYYIMKNIEEKKQISPAPADNWKFVPDDWARAASKREYVLLFGTKND